VPVATANIFAPNDVPNLDKSKYSHAILIGIKVFFSKELCILFAVWAETNILYFRGPEPTLVIHLRCPLLRQACKH
jgi:hypothetical protein